MNASRLALAALALALTAAAAPKAEFGSAKEAEALVSRAVAHVKKVGPARAYKDFTDKAPGWTDRDLYVFVNDLQGNCLAHGQNAKLVGKNVFELRDARGKLFIQQQVQLARTRRVFWQDYDWTDPVTRKLLAKSTYCERLDQTIVCVGIYRH